MNFETMLREMCGAYGPSGREDKIAAVIASYLKADTLRRDALGNLIAFRRGTSGKKVMLCAHMDQIGLVVTDIDEGGFLRVNHVGGIAPVDCIGREVIFENGLRGVVGFETESKTKKTAEFIELFVDVGARSRVEACAEAQIGDMAVFASNFSRMGSRVCSGALDDRVCCAIIAEAFNTAETPHDLYAVFTVQEEVGCRGASAAAYAIVPDLCLVSDVTLVGDTPKAKRCSMALGKGPAIKAMDLSVVVPQRVRRFLTDCAMEAEIPFQDEVIRAGGTDTGAVQRTGEGITAGCISIPCRYVHSPVEMADMEDVMDAVELFKAALAKETLPLEFAEI